MEQLTVSNISELIQMIGFQSMMRNKVEIGVGELFGLPVQVHSVSGKKAPYNFVFSLHISLDKEQIKRGNKKFKGVGVFSSLIKGTFTIAFTPKKGQAGEMYQQMLALLQEYLNEEGIYAADVCAHCGLGQPDLLGFVDGKLNKVHRNCLEEKVTQQEQQIKHDAEKSSYIKGLVGGFLGGMVAIIPSLLTIFLMNYMFVYLYALIPMGVYFGYTKFGGKLDGIVPPVFTAIFAVIQVYVIEVLVIYLELRSKYSYLNATIQDAIDLRFKYNMGLFTGDTIFALICVVVGTFVAISTFKGNSKSIVKENQELLQLTAPRMQQGVPMATVGQQQQVPVPAMQPTQPAAPVNPPQEPPIE